MVRSVGFADWFVEFKNIQNSRRNRSSKSKLKSVKTPRHELMEVARSGFWAPRKTYTRGHIF